MQQRPLGSTGIKVSVLGLGTVKFGRNEGVKYPEAFELPSDSELDQLLGVALDAGINLIDTAPAYGTSEERLGKLLQKRRQQLVIVSKAGEEFTQGESQFDYSRLAIRKSVERSLRRLKTDYIDVLLGHSNGNDLRIIKEDNIFDTFAELKQEGKICCFGMSTKTVEGGLLTLDEADVAMVTYNQLEQQDKVVLDHAHQNKKGVLIKKAFASGYLDKFASDADPVKSALRFVLAESGVSSIITGTINPAHLRENIKACDV